MASWIVHLRISDALLNVLNVDAEKFIIGSVAPDCGRMNADKLTYTPPKSVSHFSASGNNADVVYKNFFNDYIKGVTDFGAYSFFLGYLSHLVTDKLWGYEIYNPTEEKYISQFASKADFMTAIKRDWYDLDRIYLEAHPSFHAYDIIASAGKFVGGYLPYFSDEIISEKLVAIKSFYERETSVNKSREFIYLTKEQMDNFVTHATNQVCAYFTELGINMGA